MNGKKERAFKGFTLIELLVVMAVIALLLAIAAPKYFGSVDKSKEAILKQDLSVLRDSLDKYYGDKNQYPDSLEDLVKSQYLRAIPVDPITGSATTWIIVAPQDGQKGAVFDVKSGATGNARDGTPYANW